MSSPASFGGSSQVDVGVGNPINVITGNKYQREVDLAPLPGVLGLEIVRHYNSATSGLSNPTGIFGRGWKLSYETELVLKGADTLEVMQADGSPITFRKSAGPSATVGVDQWRSANAAQGEITSRKTAQGSEYRWRWANAGGAAAAGRELLFDTHGKLIQISAPTGEFVSLRHDPEGWLVEVTDPQGRSLHLNYLDKAAVQADRAHNQRFRGVQSIDSPVGRYTYGYNDFGAQTPEAVKAALAGKSGVAGRSVIDPAQLLANLVRVSLPTHYDADQKAHPYANRGVSSSSISRLYHYEDPAHPTLLTGITVSGQGSDGQQMLQRISTWAYDRYGRANLSVKGEPARLEVDAASGKPIEPRRLAAGTGIEQVTLQWPVGNSDEVVLTNALGQETRYRTGRIAGEYRLLEVRGAGCASCGPSNRRYWYDKLGRLIEETRITGDGQPIEGRRSDYDAQGRLLKVSRVGYANGKAQALEWTTRYEYAAGAESQQPVLIATPSVVAGREHQVRIAYNAIGQPTVITESGFSPVDDKGQVDAGSTAIERTSRYRYERINGRSLLAEIDGPLPNRPNGPTGSPQDSDITRYRWDGRGDRLVAIVYPMGLTATFEHDDAGRVVRAVGADGVVTLLRYDPDGSVSDINAGGAPSHLGRDAQGRLTDLNDPLGQRLRVRYDNAGRLMALADGQDNRIALRRNGEGELLQAQLLNPEGSVSQQRDFAADAAARVRDPVVAGMRRVIASAEDDDTARPAFAKAPEAALQGLLAAASASDGFERPPNASSAVLDGQGRATLYHRNDFGNIVAVTSPDTGLTAYRYNLAGQLSERRQADGSRAAYARDAAGRVTGIEAIDATGRVDEHASVVWGKANKPVQITYLAGEEHFAYDDAARLVEHTQRIDNRNFSLKYQYDTAGRLLAKTLPDGQTLRYRYRSAEEAKAGLLESVWLQGPIDRPIVEGLNGAAEVYERRRFGFGNGLTSQTLRDSRGRVVEAGNAQVGQTHLQYPADATGGATFETSNGLPPQVRQTQPVLLDRRAQAEAAQRWIAQARGVTADWLTRERGDRGRPHLLLLPGAGPGPNGADLAEDALGRATAQGATRFVYDSLSRLIEVTRDAADGAASTRVASYRYNLFGQRVAKVVYGQGSGGSGKVTYFFYDGTELVAEASGEATGTSATGASAQTAPPPITAEYVHLNGKPVALLAPGRLGSTSLYYIHTDHRNAPLALTDDARQVVWQAQVADFGAAQVDPAARIDFNLRASNQYFDAETGLHYNTNRYFDPVARRYLTPDPMGLAAGPDLYAFALNRPHEFSDPLGLAPVSNLDKSLKGWTYEDKLSAIITRAIPLVPGEVGAALQEMVKPANLATMSAVFVVFAGMQATPVGWIADLAIVGYSAWMLGSGVTEVLKTLVALDSNIDAAHCEPDLDAAAKHLANGFVTSTGEVAGGLAGVWGVKSNGGVTRIAEGIRTLVEFGKKNFAGKPLPAVVIEGNAGLTPTAPPLIRGLGGTFTESEIPDFAWAKNSAENGRTQGNPWEAKVQSELPPGYVRTAAPFKVFDHWNEVTGDAISSKTMNTLTNPRLNTPSKVGSVLKGYIDKVANFVEDTKLSVTIKRSLIKTQEIQLLVPAGTTAEQWAAINAQVKYGVTKNVKVIITVAKP